MKTLTQQNQRTKNYLLQRRKCIKPMITTATNLISTTENAY
jgi:acetylglutamate synthase